MSEDTNKFERWLKEKSVQEVELLVPDIGGIPRGKILPVKSFLKGLKGNSHRLAQAVFIQTISGEYASDVEELGYAALPKSIFNPSEVDGSYGSAGIDVVAVATLVVETPNWFVSI